MTKCDVAECAEEAVTRGWCNPHYQRWKRYGDPLVQKRIRGNDELRFWSKVNKQAPDGCWLWTGSPGRWGYAQVRMGGRAGGMVLVHRWAYENLVGPIPAGLELDHRCHTDDPTCAGGPCRHRLCVNPEHLEPVTEQENARRSRSASGVNSRKTHCIHGHAFDEKNTLITPKGNRSCRACRLRNVREWRKRTA